MTDIELINEFKSMALETLNQSDFRKGSFMYGRMQEANFYQNHNDLPLIQLLPLEHKRDYEKSVSTTEINMFFITNPPSKANHKEIAKVISDMGELCKKFENRILTGFDLGFDLGREVIARPMFEMYTGRLFGYECRFNIQFDLSAC